jgi:signal transduction histidine kinase/ligand-binding sensor domain-containing protein
MYRLKNALTIVLLFAALPVYPQTADHAMFKKCLVNTINYEQGLLNNESTAVMTDSLGFTWVSTFVGLQRYNGYTLENINPVINNDTIKIKTPVCFFNLQNGRLWISCKKGVLEYNPKTNAFKNLVKLNSLPDAFYSIIPIKESAEGIWCFQQNSGLVIYDRDGHLKKVDHSIAPALINKIITDKWYAIGNKDFIFIRDGSRRGLLQFNTTTHRFVAEREPDKEILDICCNENSVYINTPKGIYHFLINGWKLLNQCSFKAITNQSVTFSRSLIINSNKLISSVNTQLLEYDGGLNKCKIFTKIDGTPLLSTGDIEHIYCDKFERIWLITNDDIKRIQNQEIPFAYLKYPAGTNNFIRSLYFDEDKKLLLAGCLNGGLQLYDGLTNPLWKTPLVTNDVKDILSIEKLDRDSYLIITWRRGWYLLNLSKKGLTKFHFPGDSETGLLFNNIFTDNLQRINDSTIFVASSKNVFRCIFHGTHIKAIQKIFPFITNTNNQVSSFVNSSSGTLWAGCIDGSIYRMDKNGSITTMHLPEPVSIRSMTEDADNHIWVGSNSGLYVYDSQGHLKNSFFKTSGLLNDCIYSLLPANNGSAVFAGTNMGLSEISLKAGIKNYTKELGLQDNEFNTDAALKTADGKFYFGGISGISAFYPSALKQRNNRPQLNITRLVVNDSCYNSSAGIWKGDTIDLNYDQNHLQVDFAAMGILNADKYLYKYRLIGFEKNWQSTYQPTGIRYTLGIGNYLMEVSCVGVLPGPVNKTLTIIIHPPWWLTWWFLLVVAVLAVGAVIQVVSFYNKRKYQKELHDLMIKQTLQNERERISRDLHDNLGAQANAIYYGTALLKEKSNHDPQLVDNLYDTAGDMLTMLRETLWAMKITQVEAADLWLRILNFAKKINPYYPDIEIDINGTPPGKFTLNASMALNMILIVQEAISNAIRHADASVITISSIYTESLWRIEIMDDGKGFDLSEISKKTESYGLENMNERAYEFNITFEINSIPSLGTKIILEINLQKMEPQLIR